MSCWSRKRERWQRVLYLLERINTHMTTIEDAVNDLTTAVSTLAGNDATLIQTLKDALAGAGVTDPAVQAAVDAIEAQVANINTINQAVVEANTPAAPADPVDPAPTA